MKIVVYSFMEFEKPLYAGLEEKLGCKLIFTAESPTLETAELAKGADAVCVITTPINRELLQKFHSIGVKYVSTRNAGFDHIDIKAAKEMGIGVGNASYSPHNVAEYAVMLLLMSARKGYMIAEAYRRQDYSLAGKMGTMLNSLTVGVVGTGKIGGTVIKILSGFGCKILAYDPYENQEIKHLVKYVDIDTLFADSDAITFHVPATESSHHIVNKNTLAKMKDGVSLVNTSRGDVFDTEALLDALESKKVGMAALDVLEGEGPVYYQNWEGKPCPLPAIEKLSKYANVLLTPHTAFFTKQAIFEMVHNAITSCALEIKRERNPWKIV